jgi:hypothetical protein
MDGAPERITADHPQRPHNEQDEENRKHIQITLVPVGRKEGRMRWLLSYSVNRGAAPMRSSIDARTPPRNASCTNLGMHLMEDHMPGLKVR